MKNINYFLLVGTITFSTPLSQAALPGDSQQTFASYLWLQTPKIVNEMRQIEASAEKLTDPKGDNLKVLQGRYDALLVELDLILNEEKKYLTTEKSLKITDKIEVTEEEIQKVKESATQVGSSLKKYADTLDGKGNNRILSDRQKKRLSSWGSEVIELIRLSLTEEKFQTAFQKINKEEFTKTVEQLLASLNNDEMMDVSNLQKTIDVLARGHETLKKALPDSSYVDSLGKLVEELKAIK